MYDIHSKSFSQCSIVRIRAQRRLRFAVDAIRVFAAPKEAHEGNYAVSNFLDICEVKSVEVIFVRTVK